MAFKFLIQDDTIGALMERNGIPYGRRGTGA